MVPGLAERWVIESSNAAYEFVLPDSELVGMLHSGLEEAQVYGELAAAGLSSVAIEMETPRDLEREGRIVLLDREEITNQLVLADLPSEPLPDGTFIRILEGDEDALLERIAAAEPTGRMDRVRIGDHDFTVVSGVEDLEELPIGFDFARVAELRSRGFGIVARIPRALRSPAFGQVELQHLRARFGVDRVMLEGNASPFNGSPEADVQFARWLADEGFTYVLVEFSTIEGAERYAAIIPRTIRLHPMNLAQRHVAADAIEQGVRAIKERNIRIIFLRPPESGARSRLETLSDTMRGIRHRAPDHFALGTAEPFEGLSRNPLTAVGGITMAGGMGLVLGSWVGRRVAALLGAAGAAVGLSAALGPLVMGDILRLGLAIAFAIAAVFAARPARRIVSATRAYIASVAVVIIGGLGLTGLALEDRFLAGTADFFGVKALLVVPVVVTAALAAYQSLGRPGLAGLWRTAQWRVRAWQLGALAIAAVAVWYLVLRSGNTGAAADWELKTRQWLEDILYVRPRTKEFLLGFPALIAGILTTATSRHGWWLYAIASIGTASAIDTFAHFHSPLHISLLRTAYAAGLGFVIGLMALGVARLTWRWLEPRIKGTSR